VTRTMYDSVEPTVIPGNAEVVAGYVDGFYSWVPEGWARFPNATKVRIAVFASTNDGDVLDVENGDATPAQARSWLQMRAAAGVARPTIYCNRSTRSAVEAACVGIPHDLWIATLDGTQNVPGAVAVQYAGSAITGHNYDVSVVTDDTWPGGPMTLDPNDPIIQDITNRIGGLQYFIEVDGGATSKGEVTQRLRDIEGKLTTPIPVTVDAAAVAVALAGNQAFKDAIAVAVVKELGRVTSNG
jgi:hypothetical protein